MNGKHPRAMGELWTVSERFVFADHPVALMNALMQAQPETMLGIDVVRHGKVDTILVRAGAITAFNGFDTQKSSRLRPVSAGRKGVTEQPPSSGVT